LLGWRNDAAHRDIAAGGGAAAARRVRRPRHVGHVAPPPRQPAGAGAAAPQAVCPAAALAGPREATLRRSSVSRPLLSLAFKLYAQNVQRAASQKGVLPRQMGVHAAPRCARVDR
jgi:hypothetical protein